MPAIPTMSLKGSEQMSTRGLDRRHLVGPFTEEGLKGLGIVILICVLVWASPVMLRAQDRGSAAANPGDAGFNPKRIENGIVAPPAAFSGVERPDTASFIMSERLLTLSGRSLDVNLDLNYDSSTFQLSYNKDTGETWVSSAIYHPQFPAYGFTIGFGSLIHHNSFQSCFPETMSGVGPCVDGAWPPLSYQDSTFVDSTGARHRLKNGLAQDGSDIREDFQSGQYTITYPDGTKLIFGARLRQYSTTYSGSPYLYGGSSCRQTCHVYDEIYYPTKIIDRNGNFILIQYRTKSTGDLLGSGPEISSIFDTIGRTITFNYDGSNRLKSITVPGFEPNTSRVVASFEYESRPRVFGFGSPPYSSKTINALRYVYFPGTKSGYRYSYSTYGMVVKVEKLREMDTAADGVITNYGVTAATTEYDYPLFPPQPSGQIPTYTKRTDTWVGSPSPPVEHHFSVGFDYTGKKSVTVITAPGGIISEVHKRWYHPQQRATNDTMDEGVVLEATISRDRVVGEGGQMLAKIVNEWEKKGLPRLIERISIDDANQQKKTLYSYYDPPASNLNSNIKEVKLLGFSGETLRRVEYVYETRLPWVLRWLVRLPTSVKLYEGDATEPISHIEYKYDEEPPATYPTLPGTYDTSTPQQRGNVTSVVSNTNARSPSEGINIISRMSYDLFGNVVKSTDAVGNATVAADDRVTTTEFSSEYQYAFPTRATTPTPDPTGVNGSAHGHNTALSYNFNTGLLTSVTSENDRTVHYDYNDPNNRLKRVSMPDGGEVSYNYSDGLNNLSVETLTKVDSSHVIETVEFLNGRGQTVRTQTHVGGAEYATVDTEYDQLGRPSRVSNPYLSTLNAAPSPDNRLWATTVYDLLGRPLSITTPDGIKAETAYDGSRVLQTDPAGNQRLYRMSAMGQTVEVWEVTPPDGETEPISFPQHPEVTAGYRTTYTYDAIGNIRKVVQGEQRRYFAYDSLSHLIRVRIPEQQARTDLSLPASLLSPLSDNNNNWTTAFEYDENGNIKTRTDARGVKTTYKYDGLDRLIGRSYSHPGGAPSNFTATPDAEYFYDGKGLSSAPANARGRLTLSRAGGAEYRFTAFDAMGRVETFAQVVEGQAYEMQYAYNLGGGLESETYPSGRRISYTLDSVGRLGQVTGQLPGHPAQVYASNFGYTAHGPVEKMRLGNGLWEHKNFDAQRLMLTRIGLGLASTDSSLLRIDYDYAPLKNNGNILSQRVTLPNLPNPLIQTYKYDSLNRLRSAEETSGGVRQWIQTFAHDRYGNRSVDTRLDNGQPRTTPSLVGPNPEISTASNRIINRAGTNEAYAYDGNGNLVKDRNGDKFHYDGESRQSEFFAAANPAVPVAVYTYDDSGRRVKKQEGADVTVFVYNLAGQLIAEYGAAQFAGGGGTMYVTPDALGSPRLVTDKDGNPRARHDYHPYGEEINSGGFGNRGSVQGYGGHLLRQRFTGYIRDGETDLDFAQARYYATHGGRFTTVDPLLSSAHINSPQTFNRYAYCGNNPINCTDPSGLEWYYNFFSLGYKQPVWFDGIPDAGYVPWVFGDVYFSREDGRFHVLHPTANQKWDFATKAEADAKFDSVFRENIGEVQSPPVMNSMSAAAPDNTGVFFSENWLPTGLFVQWVSGAGPRDRQFGPDSYMTQGMRTSPDVNIHRDSFINQGGGVYGPNVVRFGRLSAEDGPFEAGLNMPRQFVGSFYITITEKQNGDALFVLTNTTGLESFLYGAVHNVDRSTMAPLSNKTQTYFWVEKGVIRR